jgi:hypothetical protein
MNQDQEEVLRIAEKAYVVAITSPNMGKSSPMSMKLHDFIVQFHPLRHRRIQQLQSENGIDKSTNDSFRRGNMAAYSGSQVRKEQTEVKKTKMEDWNPKQQDQNQSGNVAGGNEPTFTWVNPVEADAPPKRGRKSKAND